MGIYLTLDFPCFQFIEEAERSLHDAIMIVRRALKNSTVVAGGGAIDVRFHNNWLDLHEIHQEYFGDSNVIFWWQMEISRYLRQHARTIAGKSQLFINSYAKALEVCLLGFCILVYLEMVWLTVYTKLLIQVD